MKIRLLAAMWAPSWAAEPFRAGDVVEVEAADFDRLTREGLAVDADAPEPAPEPVVPDKPVAAPEPESVEVLAKPRKVDKLEAWQDYARAVGIGTHGMTKTEIIDAVG